MAGAAAATHNQPVGRGSRQPNSAIANADIRGILRDRAQARPPMWRDPAGRVLADVRAACGPLLADAPSFSCEDAVTMVETAWRELFAIIQDLRRTADVDQDILRTLLRVESGMQESLTLSFNAGLAGSEDFSSADETLDDALIALRRLLGAD
jgi:hypothetical protein